MNQDTSNHSSDKSLIKARQLQERLGGISNQTLWRHVRNPKLDFPKPIYICGVRYWVNGDIDAFIERQREKGAS